MPLRAQALCSLGIQCDRHRLRPAGRLVRCSKRRWTGLCPYLLPGRPFWVFYAPAGAVSPDRPGRGGGRAFVSMVKATPDTTAVAPVRARRRCKPWRAGARFWAAAAAALWIAASGLAAGGDRPVSSPSSPSSPSRRLRRAGLHGTGGGGRLRLADHGADDGCAGAGGNHAGAADPGDGIRGLPRRGAGGRLGPWPCRGACGAVGHLREGGDFIIDIKPLLSCGSSPAPRYIDWIATRPRLTGAMQAITAGGRWRDPQSLGLVRRPCPFRGSGDAHRRAGIGSGAGLGQPRPGWRWG